MSAKPPRPRVIYLDQWVWIRLARAHHGEEPLWAQAHDAVVDAVRDGTARFPLSLSHLQETASRSDALSREKLVNFMASIWNADAILPWTKALQPEADNVVRGMLGESQTDLGPRVIGKGIGYLLGSYPTLVPKAPGAPPLPPEVHAKVNEVLTSPNLLLFWNLPEVADAIRESRKKDAEMIARVQATVDEDYSHPDKAYRERIVEGRFMVRHFGEYLVNAMHRLAPDPTGMMRARFSTREDLIAILEGMPTLHTFYVLTHARNKSRRLKPNDIWDLALSIAIPYCDVVVTERAWCNIAQKARLGDKYNTALIHTSSGLQDTLITP